MAIADGIFYISLDNSTRIFDDHESLRLEWSPEGLKVCKNTCDATIVLDEENPITLSNGSVIKWDRFVRGKFYSLLKSGNKTCEFRVYDQNSNDWLNATNGESTPSIMLQTALVLENLYSNSTSIEVLTHCLETAKFALSTVADEEFKQVIINRWIIRLKKEAARTLTDPQSTLEQLNTSYSVLKKYTA